ncbi:hypothetical protein V6Z12_D03G096800 [Gossypium hirsutum]
MHLVQGVLIFLLVSYCFSGTKQFNRLKYNKSISIFFNRI